jgi:hypothetical protein
LKYPLLCSSNPPFLNFLIVKSFSFMQPSQPSVSHQQSPS